MSAVATSSASDDLSSSSSSSPYDNKSILEAFGVRYTSNHKIRVSVTHNGLVRYRYYSSYIIILMHMYQGTVCHMES